MIRLLLILFLFLLTQEGHPQKKALELTSAESWPVLTPLKISNDGKFVLYRASSSSGGSKLTVQATDSSWTQEMEGASGDDASFTEDSRYVIFTKQVDSLFTFNLEIRELRYTGLVSSFKAPAKGNGAWLAFLLKSPMNELRLLNLFTGESRKYTDVENYTFNPDGRVLVICSASRSDSVQTHTVDWVDIRSGNKTTICRNYAASQYMFDETGLLQLAFTTKDVEANQTVIKIRYYHPGMDSAKVLVEPLSDGMNGMLISSGEFFFSKKGDKLFFNIQKPLPPNAGGQLPNVHLWNYKDDSFQLAYHCYDFLSVIHLNAKLHVIRLQQDQDRTYFMELSPGDSQDYVVFTSNRTGNGSEYKWRISARADICLVSTSDGSRKVLRRRILMGADPFFSPGGKYLIWYESQLSHWIACNLTNGVIKNITRQIKEPLYEENDYPDYPDPCGIAGWVKNDNAVLIYDRFDIWQVDPIGIKPPVNLTRGYGRINGVRLRYLDFFNRHVFQAVENDTLLLSGFDIKYKQNGFFKLSLNANHKLRKLSMSSDIVYFPYRYMPPSITGIKDPFYPLKAKECNAYIVEQMDAKTYPNLYFTADFIHFKPLTNLQPQRQYNWLTSELIRWKMKDNRVMEGILYKPENFNPQKKYPVIFSYYQRNADALHLFIQPQLSNGLINIPWFVSNGYLVFVPDIVFYERGHPGECAFQAVVSGARYLSRYNWVDSHKLGLQGHSFGGWQTNYIVTKTHLFAAAAPAAGTSNLISAYGASVMGRGGTWFYESRQGRIGSSLWERPDLYIENSPIFRADRVTTPLLIMHNMDDHVVQFDQEREWFNSLNRLGKKVWLLYYDGESHTIYDKINQFDYSTRLMQFFDYYLKDTRPPVWMTRGLPEFQGGIIDPGLELDTMGARP